MTNLVHSLGLELPVFDEKTRVVNFASYDSTLEGTEPTFIRRIALDYAGYYGTDNLRGVLKRTDEVLEDVAEHCGALVVPHTWGLKKAREQYQVSDLLPRGHYLVAEVDRVISAGGPMPLGALQLLSLYANSVARETGTSGYVWDDFGPHQFMYGTTHDNPRDTLYLVDIEPMITKV